MTDFIVSSFRRKLRAAATAPMAVAAHRRDCRLFPNLRWGRVIPLVAKADDALTKSPGSYCAPSLLQQSRSFFALRSSFGARCSRQRDGRLDFVNVQSTKYLEQSASSFVLNTTYFVRSTHPEVNRTRLVAPSSGSVCSVRGLDVRRAGCGSM